MTTIKHSEVECIETVLWIRNSSFIHLIICSALIPLIPCGLIILLSVLLNL